MKRASHYILITIFLLACQACHKSPKEIESAYIENRFESFKPDPDKRWMIILPGLGCKGCIQEGETFLQQHVSNNSILFVLTKIESLKLLQQKTGIDLKNRTNVVIDKSNSFELPSKNSIYPLIIELKDSKVKDYQFQSPENSDAFSRLEDKI